MNYPAKSLLLFCGLLLPVSLDLIYNSVQAHHTPSHVGTIAREQPRHPHQHHRVKLLNSRAKHLHGVSKVKKVKPSNHRSQP
jgi:hypothetical protein